MHLLFVKNEKWADKTLLHDLVRGMGEHETGAWADAGRNPFMCNKEKVWLKLTLSMYAQASKVPFRWWGKAEE